MGSSRRDPRRPGTAGLTDADAEALAAGRTTTEELGARVGVSKQMVSKWLRGRKGASTAPSSTSAPAPSTAPPTTSTTTSSPASIGTPEDLAEALRGMIVGAGCSLLEQLFLLGKGENTHLGASALKASVTALQGLTDILERAGAVQLADGSGPLAEMTIRIMSPEEGDALRASRDRELAGDYGPADDTA